MVEDEWNGEIACARLNAKMFAASRPVGTICGVARAQLPCISANKMDSSELLDDIGAPRTNFSIGYATDS
jgi:hypothetical protein